MKPTWTEVLVWGHTGPGVSFVETLLTKAIYSVIFTNFHFGGCYKNVGLWLSKITPTPHGPVFTIKQVTGMYFQDEMFAICFSGPH